MTVVTADLRDVAGNPDNQEWIFKSAWLREDATLGHLVTPKTIRRKPVGGILTVDLEPGLVEVTYAGTWLIAVPDSDDPVDLWDLIAASVIFPNKLRSNDVGVAVGAHMKLFPGEVALSAVGGAVSQLVPNAVAGQVQAQVPPRVGEEIANQLEPLILPVVTADLEGRNLGVEDAGDGSAQFTLGGVNLGDPFQLPATTWSGVAGKPPIYAPLPGSSPTENRLGLQAAIDDAIAAGGGRVVLYPGATYVVDIETHPAVSTIATALRLDSDVHLDLNGAYLQLADGLSAPAGLTGDVSDMLSAKLMMIGVNRPYSNATAAHHNIRVSNGTLDGAAADQTIQFFGLWLSRTRSAWVEGVKIKNVRGVGSAPPGETFFFEALNCTDVHYMACEAVCDDDSDTATGFSANNSTNVSWLSCVSRDMKHGMGFTHWQSAGLHYAACNAYGNGGAGFNSERSECITYMSCEAGFRSAPVASAQPGPFWGTVQQQTGNAFGGFTIQGSKIVELIGCRARYNTSSGLIVKDNNATTPTMVSDQIRVIGGQYGPGNGRGVEIASTATNIAFIGHVDTAGNTAVDLIPTGPADFTTAAMAGAPYHFYRNLNDSAGMRFNVVRSNGSGPPTGFGYRWYVGGGLAATITTGLDLVVSRSLRPGQYANADRPGAVSVGAGAMIWNTTTNKPNFSDGSVWRDATGALA